MSSFKNITRVIGNRCLRTITSPSSFSPSSQAIAFQQRFLSSETDKNLNTKLTQPDDKPQFPGSRSDWTSRLEFLRPDAYPGIPVYRVMDRTGTVLDENMDPNLGQEMITKMYKGKHSFSFLISMQ